MTKTNSNDRDVVTKRCSTCVWWRDKNCDDYGRSPCVLLSGESDSEEIGWHIRNSGRFLCGPNFGCAEHEQRFAV